MFSDTAVVKFYQNTTTSTSYDPTLCFGQVADTERMLLVNQYSSTIQTTSIIKFISPDSSFNVFVFGTPTTQQSTLYLPSWGVNVSTIYCSETSYTGQSPTPRFCRLKESINIYII